MVLTAFNGYCMFNICATLEIKRYVPLKFNHTLFFLFQKILLKVFKLITLYQWGGTLDLIYFTAMTMYDWPLTWLQNDKMML